MAEIAPLLAREEFAEVGLDFDRIGIGREAEAQGETPDMGVNDDPLVDLEGITKYDIGSLASDAGKRGKCLHGPGDFACVLLHECLTHGPD